MPRLEFTRRFLKDMKKWKRSGVNMDPLEEFIHTIQDTWPPPAKYEPHILVGALDGVWDVHLRQNWVLLLRFHAGTVRFLRMGTHAELGI